MAMAMSLSIASTPSRLTFTPPPPPFSQSAFHGIRFSVPLPKRILIASASSSTSLTVKMSKKDEELKDIRAKTNEELNDEIVTLKGELFMLRLQRSARNEFKQSDFRTFRKRIARLLTVKRERELDEGINKRLSRKLDRQWRKSIVPRPPPSLVKLTEEQAEAKESA